MSRTTTRTSTKGRVAALAGLLVLVGALPALGAPPEDGYTPVLRQERVYFHCTGATKVHNTINDGAVRWNTTAPTQSVTAGAGCGSVDNPLHGSNQVSVQDSHFRGTYTANLDTMTVELHNIYAGPARTSGPLTFNVRLTVDGVPRLGTTGAEVVVQPVRSSSGASEMVRFSVVGLGLLHSTENIEHDVHLTVSGGAVVGSAVVFPVRDTLSTWVYDTTEVPSGITFAPSTLQAVKVTATPPPPLEG